ncbi:hypothetical protein VF13_41545 [Nostoc linckia z16]|nr:hypothetical protein VF13_41545 [Nostoc linckia z16]
MKIFSLVLSVTVFCISLYFFSVDVTNINGIDDGIYLALLCILMAICVVGIIINWDMLWSQRRKNVILFVNNPFSKKNKKTGF